LRQLLIFLLILTGLPLFGQMDSMKKEILLGYAIPVNASYVDTYQNHDIYWNPNSGLNLDLRLEKQINEHFSLIVPLNTNIGFTRYNTTDGRKVNTEADAGNTPETINTEWSVAPDIGIMLKSSLGGKRSSPYIALGMALGYLHSWESWEFTNVDGQDVTLIISKYYDPSPVFKGELGWEFPLENKEADLRIVAGFNMVNYIMKQVVLTHYMVAGNDRIGDYDSKSTVYNYAFNAPDENKGGDCLLAGFTYNNYPQQKISTNFTIKIGLSYGS